MIKVGLTGGYASGKTYVAGELENLGCHVIHADRLGHLVLQPGGDAYGPVLEEFGRGILTGEGIIDRKKLASIVFINAAQLQKLNGIVHPAVFRLEEKMLEQFLQNDPKGIAVIEAAILIETGRYRQFDHLIVTVCDRETQITRGMARDNLTREEVVARLEQQMSLDEKVKYADYIIDTSGPKAATSERVRRVYEDLRMVAGV
ncbi:MAG: dephospho-CoA kinase [Acidobacteriaceae bacterium]|nr:dephospho-CoA kinase [Acidobacteriaceae bacterium]